MLKLFAPSPCYLRRNVGVMRGSIVASLALLLGLGCATTGTGPLPDDPIRPTEPTQDLVDALVSPGANPLAELNAARQESSEARFGADFNWVSGLWFAELGALYEAANLYTPFNSAPYEEAPDDGQCDSSELPDAVEELCRLMTEVDPDTLEENPDALPPQHFFIEDRPNYPMMRVFGQQLLECAKEAGFRFFAVEALQEEGAAVQARGYVTRSSGLYVREPQMAKLIDRAIELEFDLVSYDVPGRPANFRYARDVREYGEEQATNLLAKTHEVDPEARMLVWTSPRNARRTEWRVNNERTSSLGNRVWDATGIEPFSMDQIALEPGLSFGDQPDSGAYLAAGPDNGACAGAFYPETVETESALNGIVMHRAPDDRDARWDWLNAADEQRMTLNANCSDCTGVTELLVQAFVAGHDRSERVPADQALCRAGADCPLKLQPGDYDVVVWSVSEQLGVQAVSLEAGGSASLTF